MFCVEAEGSEWCADRTAGTAKGRRLFCRKEGPVRVLKKCVGFAGTYGRSEGSVWSAWFKLRYR